MNTTDLTTVLIKEAFVLDCDAFDTKESAFEFMSNKFFEAKIITDKNMFIEALEEREALGPTYMGSYIGLPHGKSDCVIKPGIAFCRCKEPFTYKSYDEEGQVKFIFMLAIPKEQEACDYMRVLAKLAGLLTHEEFLEKLNVIQSYEEILLEMKKYDN